MIYGFPGQDFSDLEKVVRKTVNCLKVRKQKFDSIVVSGISGIVVGAPVSVSLKMPLIVVRKDSDTDHHSGGSNQVINFDNLGKRYIFLDDFVSSGNTRDFCNNKILDYAKLHNVNKPVRIATFEYSGFCWLGSKPEIQEIKDPVEIPSYSDFSTPDGWNYIKECGWYRLSKFCAGLGSE